MVSERSSERSIQQALQVQTVKKDENDRKNFKKGKNNPKGGNWSKGKNKGSEKDESSKEGNSNQNKKKGFDKKKIQCFKCETLHLNIGLVRESKSRMMRNKLRLHKKVQTLSHYT